VRDAIATRAIGNDAALPVSKATEQPLEKALRRGGVAPVLNEYVEYDAIPIGPKAASFLLFDRPLRDPTPLLRESIRCTRRGRSSVAAKSAWWVNCQEFTELDIAHHLQRIGQGLFRRLCSSASNHARRPRARTAKPLALRFGHGSLADRLA
jgi:hypothetical protein